MATPTFSNTPTVLSDCDSMTGWTGNSGETDADLKKEGNASLVFIFSTNGNNDAYFEPVAAVDLSNTHIRLWFLATNYSHWDIKANGGLQFFVSDGVDTGYWYVHGKDTYAGGWVLLTIDTALGVDSGVKPTMTAITEVGVRVATLTKPKTADNTWLDLLCYGDGYTITGGSDGDKITWQDIADTDVDTTEGWGIVQKINGIFFVNGKLIFGDGAGTGSCYFADTGETVVFLDEPVNANLYEIKVEGNATGTTKFQMGTKSGSRGISGCLIRAAGTQDFDITSTDADIDELKLYGCTFLNADSVQLPPAASGREVIDCAFEVCGEVLPDTCVVQYCDFINADDRGIRMSSTSHNITDCNFINCGHGVHIPSGETYTFDNLQFSGCTYDIENSGASADVIVNAINGANPGTYENTGAPPGTTTINNTKTLTVTTKNTSGLAIQAVNVRIEKDPSGELISEGQTDVNGEYTDATYNYLGDQDVLVVARKKGLSNNRAFDTIRSTGLSVPFTMIRDASVNMP